MSRAPARGKSDEDIAPGRACLGQGRLSHQSEPAQPGGGAGTWPSTGHDTSHDRIQILKTSPTNASLKKISGPLWRVASLLAPES